MGLRRRWSRAARTLLALMALAGATPVAAPLAAQRAPSARLWLPLDTVLAPRERVGCEGAPGGPQARTSATATPAASVVPTPVNTAAARTAWREAHEALLDGDRTRARARLQDAVSHDPRDARAWLELASTHEALGDSTAARLAACRALALPNATPVQRDDAERHWRRLLTSQQQQERTRAIQRHAEGIRFARGAQWQAAREAFDDVVRIVPSAPSAWRNRAVVTAEAGDRQAAERDLERYLQIGESIPDRVAMARALAALRRPRYGTATALAAGLLPGGAQFYTGRRAAGMLVLASVAGAGAMAGLPRSQERTVEYLDPNGQPAPFVERYRTYPYRTVGIVAGSVILVAAAIEGGTYASRSAVLPVFAVVPTPGARSLASSALLVGLKHRF